MDPHFPADSSSVIWLPRYDLRLTILARLPAALFEGPALAPARAALIRTAPEGDYVELLQLPPSRQALLLNGLRGPVDGPLAMVVPLDPASFEDRLDAGRRLLGFLSDGRVRPATLTPYRRHRLKLALRALDAALEGADYRSVAVGLFGARVPAGSAFRDDSFRAQTIRLVRYGLHLMNGGYLDLLKPERRAPKRRSRRV